MIRDFCKIFYQSLKVPSINKTQNEKKTKQKHTKKDTIEQEQLLVFFFFFLFVLTQYTV